MIFNYRWPFEASALLAMVLNFRPILLKYYGQALNRCSASDQAAHPFA